MTNKFKLDSTKQCLEICLNFSIKTNVKPLHYYFWTIWCLLVGEGLRVYFCGNNEFYVEYRPTKNAMLTSISLNYISMDFLKSIFKKKLALYTYFFVKTNWTQNTASLINLWNISNVKSAFITWRSGWLAKKILGVKSHRCIKDSVNP